MSEVLGRRKLFIGTYILFTIFNGGVIASQNVWTLIILRFLAGTAGSSPLTNAGGTVSDVFDAGQRGLGMAVSNLLLARQSWSLIPDLRCRSIFRTRCRTYRTWFSSNADLVVQY